MATHSSILTGRFARTEEPERLQSMRSQSRTQLSNWAHRVGIRPHREAAVPLPSFMVLGSPVTRQIVFWSLDDASKLRFLSRRCFTKQILLKFPCVPESHGRLQPQEVSVILKPISFCSGNHLSSDL